MAALDAIEAAPSASLDPELHQLEGSAEDVARYLLTLDSINFGSGWFPTLAQAPGPLRLRHGRGAPCRELFRAAGPWRNEELRSARHADGRRRARAAARPRADVALRAGAARPRALARRRDSAIEALGRAGGLCASARRGASADAMALFRDRASTSALRSLAADLALAGVASFDDLDRSDDLRRQPRAARAALEGCSCTRPPRRAHRRRAPASARPAGARDPCLRAACLRAARRRHGVAPRVLDNWLWNRGQRAAYKARPRHRCRCVYLLTTSRAVHQSGGARACDSGATNAAVSRGCDRHRPQRTTTGRRRRATELGDGAFELGDAGRERAHRVGDRIRQVDPVGVGSLDAAPSMRTGWPGTPTTVAFGGTSRTTTLLAPILAPCPIVDRPEQLGARADRDVVLHRGVALAGREAGAAEGHALVERDAVTDHRRLADHHARAVVDEQPGTDLRGGWISIPVSARAA